MTEIINDREKSENEALIYKHIFSVQCNLYKYSIIKFVNDYFTVSLPSFCLAQPSLFHYTVLIRHTCHQRKFKKNEVLFHVDCR